MAQDMHRAQILLPTDQHEAIRKIAEKEKRSISDIIREILALYLAERSESARMQKELQVLEEMRKIREEAEHRYGIYTGNIINEVREERERQIDTIYDS